MFPLIDTLYIRNSPRNSLDITIASPDSDLLIEINLGEIDILLISVFFKYSEQLFHLNKKYMNHHFFEINNIITQNKTTNKYGLWII